MTETPTTENSTIDARLFGFLARLWIAEPDKAVLRGLNEDSTRETWKSLGGFIPEDNPNVVEELSYQYCSCFLGPKGHLPPHQSVVEQSHFQGECLSSLQTFIEIIGMPDGEHFASYDSMLDHIGIELALMQKVCAAEAEADGDEKSSLVAMKREFHKRHLDWIPRYCTVAKERTSIEFYRGLFDVTQAFLADFGQRLAD